jgi:hypothetical protein
MPFDFSRSALVSGPVKVFSLVKLDPSNNFQVMQGTAGSGSAGDACVGVVQKGEENAPPYSDGYAAQPGGNALSCMYYGQGAPDIALQISATVTAGQYLKCDANGFGTPCTTAGDKICARAKQSGIALDIIDVDVFCNGSEYPG